MLSMSSVVILDRVKAFDREIYECLVFSSFQDIYHCPGHGCCYYIIHVRDFSIVEINMWVPFRIIIYVNSQRVAQ